MTPTIALDRETARRFLVLRHDLAPPRSLPAEPASVMVVMDRLGSLQFDPLDIWWQEGVDPLMEEGLVAGFGDAVAALALFGKAHRVTWPRTARHRPFTAAMRTWLADTGRLTA